VDEQAQNLIELNGKMERMMDGIESVKEKQNEMADGIDKIKEAVYNPDEGIYARLRELENWKETSSKLIWMIVASVIGLSATLIARVMLAGGP
jgi:hypothetical protein|tara:strand:- start:495 stop:773 length:279 start_codon:yes stop_codon:yes gene_type:complete